MVQRRARLAADIARQRVEFSSAYRDMGKPIRYFEYGMRGFGFLRQNPWVLSVVPAAFTISSAVVGMVRTPKPEPKRSLFEKLTRTEARKKVESKAEKSLLGHAMHWGGRGWKLYGLYKKVRKFL
jgi:hypothetical protein